MKINETVTLTKEVKKTEFNCEKIRIAYMYGLFVMMYGYLQMKKLLFQLSVYSKCSEMFKHMRMLVCFKE